MAVGGKPIAATISRTSCAVKQNIWLEIIITTLVHRSRQYFNPMMEFEITEIADTALSQPDIVGYICVDKDGLCLAAKGQVQQSISGMVHQIATLANKIEEPTRSHYNGSKSGNESATKPPVIRVDLDKSQMLIQQRDQITTALISSRR